MGLGVHAGCMANFRGSKLLRRAIDDLIAGRIVGLSRKHSLQGKSKVAVSSEAKCFVKQPDKGTIDTKVSGDKIISHQKCSCRYIIFATPFGR